MGNQNQKPTIAKEPKAEEFDFKRRQLTIEHAQPHGPFLAGLYFQSPNIINILQKDHPKVAQIVADAIRTASKQEVTVEHVLSELMVDQLTVSGVSFASDSTEEYRKMSQWLCQIFKDLMNADWSVLVGSDVSFRYTDISTLFLEYGEVEKQPTNVMYISINYVDIIDIYLGPAPSAELGAELRAICQESSAVDQEQSEFGLSMFSLKLVGQPWHTYKTHRYRSLAFLMDLLKTVNRVGYDYIEKVNLHREIDCWFFGDTLSDQNFDIDKSRFVLSLEGGDHLVIVRPPPGIEEVIEENLSRVWSFEKVELAKGEQQQKVEQGKVEQELNKIEDNDNVELVQIEPEPVVEPDVPPVVVSTASWKIKGMPWDSDHPDTVSLSCIFLTNLFKSLYGIGFRIHLTADTSQAESDKSTFIFERSAEPRRISVIALNLVETDKIRFIYGGGYGDCGADLSRKIRYFLHNYWHKGLSMEIYRMDGAVAEFTFKGYPWGSDKVDTAFARSMLCDLLTLLSHEGYQLLTSAEVCSKHVIDSEMAHTKHSLDIDTWFLGKLVEEERDFE